MADKQRTISQPVTLTGKGLHTGVDVEVTICPAEVNTGVNFQRTDLEGQPKIEAVADNVIDTSRGTSIGTKNVKVNTIEHMVAALYGMGIDNALVKVNGPEMPIMDGSSRFFVEAIASVGTVEQGAIRNYFTIKEKMVFSDEKNGIEIVAYPDDGFSIDLMVDYNSRVLGHQYAKMGNIDEFA
ncbi:MAG TPA: UDP-3-O-acyl-N-acetylglucosamine deacetylase, partial [Tenuifilaceae bacterium]|nr:UDP-3-O-acyl-N-acetylglucosamine deacetylase [Tenuifilaceae bacterium]